MDKEKGFIKYIVIIVVILALVFLSQMPYFKQIGRSLILNTSKTVQGYMAKGSNWVQDKVFPKINGEVQKREGIIKNEVNQEKQKVSENIGDKIKNYFSGIVDSVIHPGNNNNSTSCQTIPATGTK